MPELLYYLLPHPGRSRNRLLDLLRPLEKRILSPLSLRQRHRNAPALRAEETPAELHPARHRKSHPQSRNDSENQIHPRPGTETDPAVRAAQSAPRCSDPEILFHHLKTKNSVRRMRINILL